MNVHAKRGALQRIEVDDAGRFNVSNAARFARRLCACPICARPEPRIYRSSPRSVTLQCGRCGLQWTITWYMLARAFEREVAPQAERRRGRRDDRRSERPRRARGPWQKTALAPAPLTSRAGAVAWKCLEGDGCMAGTPRHRLATVFLGSALLWLATGGVAAAQSPQASLTPRASHVGVVVTTDEVFVSWHRLQGPGKVVVRRGQPGCPRTIDQGATAGEVSRLHVIDRSVKAGTAYCYSVFLRDPSGIATREGVTGTVNVPDTSNVPPAQAPPPLAAPTIAHTKLDPALVHRLEVGGARRRGRGAARARPARRRPPRRPRAHGAAADRPRVDRRPQLGRPCRPRHDPARLDRRRDRIRGAAVSARSRVLTRTLPAPRRARRRRLRRRAAPGRVREVTTRTAAPVGSTELVARPARHRAS